MTQFWSLMGPALTASVVMAPLHALMGLHVVRRGIIFIDLAIAQVAALGVALAVYRGYDATSFQTMAMGFGFAIFGALLFALTRFRPPQVPHEAIIGIVFVIAQAVGILVLARTAHGLEELKNLLTGSILVVEEQEVKKILIWYVGILVALLALWKPTTLLSHESPEAPKGVGAVVFDFLFYALIGIMVTWSVRVAGVLVVFTWLVMPAVCAYLFTEKILKAVGIAIAVTLVSSLGGLALSYIADFPTGEAMVAFYGIVVALLYGARLAWRKGITS
ncbi:MAG: metal ABC transporter permease [Fimbriimonadales bacterium]|nr:metal ABC transporter permease [Fimbriimonadales bacterium]